MNTKSQEYFLELARCCNFTRAAKNLYISQTALSKTINGLEEELGTKLFIRERNNVSLTKAGETYLQYARKLVEIAAETKDVIHDSRISMGTLRIGFPVLNDSLINIIGIFHKRFPDVQVRLYSDQVSGEAFSSSKLDMIMISEEEAQGLDYVLINRTRTLCAVMSVDHRLAGNKVLELQDLKDEQLVFSIDENGELDEAYQYCVDAGFEPRVSFLYNDAKYQLDIILNSEAIAMTFNLFRMFRESIDSIVTIPIDLDVGVKNRFVLAYRKDSRNPLVAEMAKCASEYMDMRTRLGI